MNLQANEWYPEGRYGRYITLLDLIFYTEIAIHTAHSDDVLLTVDKLTNYRDHFTSIG